jgi:hypothetical protein
MPSRRIAITVLIATITTALLLACQIPLPGRPTPSPGGQGDAEQQLAYYIMSEFITAENPHYVTWVAPVEKPGPLPAQTVLGAWKCEGGLCLEVPLDEPAQKLEAESGSRWQYSYYTFAIMSLNADATRATIRLDQLHGPLAGLGEEIVLVKEGGKWVEESRKGLWIS